VRWQRARHCGHDVSDGVQELTEAEMVIWLGLMQMHIVARTKLG
jgi:hypothetical protein